MSDEEFILYCRSHCRTERAGFLPEHIERLLRLAGDERSKDWVGVPVQIISYGPDAIVPLCDRAEQLLS